MGHHFLGLATDGHHQLKHCHGPICVPSWFDFGLTHLVDEGVYIVWRLHPESWKLVEIPAKWHPKRRAVRTHTARNGHFSHVQYSILYWLKCIPAVKAFTFPKHSSKSQTIISDSHSWVRNGGFLLLVLLLVAYVHTCIFPQWIQ